MLNKPSMIISLLAIAALLITAVLTIAVLLPSKPVSAPLVIDPLPQIILSGDREATVELTGSGFDQSLQVWITPEVSDRQAILSSLSIYGPPQQFIIRNRLAYIANGPSGVMIVDISDRKSPTVLGSLKIPGIAVQLDVQDKVALVAAGQAGLHLLDLSDLTAPRQLSTLTTAVPAVAVASQNHLAYVSCGQNGLQVIDFSDPLHLRSICTLKLPGTALNLAIQNHTLIVSLGKEYGIAILDISLPTKPRLISELRFDGYTGNCLAFKGDHALVGVSIAKGLDGSLYAIDLTIPSQPHITSVIPVGGRPLHLSWPDDRATLTLGPKGFRNFDLSDPARPHLESSFWPPGSTFFATLNDDTAWTIGTDGQLNSLDLNHNTMPVTSATIPVVELATQPLLLNNRLYLASRPQELTIYDVSNPNHPVLLGSLPVSGNIRKMVLSRESIFLAIENDNRSGTLLIADLTSPVNPQLLSTLTLPHVPWPVGLVDNTLVLAVANDPALTTIENQPLSLYDTLKFIDISSPREPKIVSVYPLSMIASNLGLDNDHRLSLISPKGIMQVIDLRNPLHPSLLGKLEMAWAEQSAWEKNPSPILFHNKIGLVSTTAGEIKLINLEDPDHPTVLGTLAAGGRIFSMEKYDNLLLVSVLQRGVRLFDLQTPTQPRLIGTLTLPGTSQFLTIENKRLWYSFGFGRGVLSARMPLLLDLKVTSGQSKMQLKIPTEALEEGDYSLWFSTKEKHVERPAMIRHKHE